MSGVAISKTSGVLEVLSKTTGASKGDVIAELDALLSVTGKTVVLDSPQSLTVKRGDTYSKIPMIGGEEFSVVGAYMGKRDGVIVRMLRNHEGEAAMFEMPASKAEECLIGYEELIERFLTLYGDQDIGNDSERIEDEAHAAAILQSRMNDHRFGSW